MSSPAAPRGRVSAAFERRAARAETLAGASEAAEEPLRFAAGLYRAQGFLASTIERVHADRPLSGRSREDVERFLGAGSEVLRFAAEHGPPILAEQARARGGEDSPVARDRLLTATP